MPYPIIPGHVSVGRILEAPGVDEDALGEPLSQGDVVTFGVGVGPLDAAPDGRGGVCPGGRVDGVLFAGNRGDEDLCRELGSDDFGARDIRQSHRQGAVIGGMIHHREQRPRGQPQRLHIP